MSEEKWIRHCSHTEHKLKEVYTNSSFTCKVCKSEGTGNRYQCNPCDVGVHPLCGTLPETLSSFAHLQHRLFLRPRPYLLHKCRLCRGFVRGMVYRCEAEGCKFFLHPTCSLVPEVWENHPKHPPHPLQLHYLESKEECDVCEKKCKHWRYHCKDCGVHIHVGCLLKTARATAPNARVTHAVRTNHVGSGVDVWAYVELLANVVQLAQVVQSIVEAVSNI